MKTLPILGLVLAAGLVPGLAAAQPGGEGREAAVAERFADLDANGDGVISRSEVEAKISSDFADADEDGDGTLSEDEARAFHTARHEQRRERRREHRGGDRYERRAGDDGVIDQDEFAERGVRRFEMADLDENGQVTETEMRLAAEARRGRHHGRRHGRHGDDE